MEMFPKMTALSHSTLIPKLDLNVSLFVCMCESVVSLFNVWWEVSKLKALDGEMRFPCLVKLMTGHLTIPVSNADSERAFSTLRYIRTDQRPSLSQKTSISLMIIKFKFLLSQLLLRNSSESNKTPSKAIKNSNIVS